MVKAIVGANWGDEGKGKITDTMAAKADIVVRFQGGANALNVNGEILVCFAPFITNWNKCQDEKGNNKWQSIHSVQIPGFKAHAYKYVNVGSGGYRNLYVFFKKVN